MSYKCITYFKKYYKIGLLVSVVFFFLMTNSVFSKEPPAVIQPVKDEVVIKTDPVIEEFIFIDIKGQVTEPGVYKMNITDRVIDAVLKAGGVTGDADSRSVNLSQKLKDEMMIYIPKIAEITCNQVPVIDETKGDTRVSINKVDQKTLMTLPGIGESKANDIIKYREEKGEFKKIEDIKNVTGIGDATFNNIKDLITI